jgi:hypothetical protein
LNQPARAAASAALLILGITSRGWAQQAAAPAAPSDPPVAAAPAPTAPAAEITRPGQTPRPAPKPSRSNEERVAYAERLFQHGVELMKDDDCPAAVPEFLTSQELDPSAATLVNLATCYARLGRRATAWKTYRRAATAAAVEGNEALRNRAFHAMSVLSPSLTKLRIVTTHPDEALALRVNGEAIGEYDGVPIPLDPGESIVEAAAPGREPWRRSVTAGELGATLVIEVPELRPVRAAETAANLRTPAVVIGGIGLAALVVGSIVAVNAISNDNQSEAYCRAGRCTAEGVRLRERASSQAAVATYAIGLGTAVTAAGVVLWFMSPPAPKSVGDLPPWEQPLHPAFGVSVRGKL